MSTDVNLYARIYIEMAEKLEAAFNSEGIERNNSKPDWAYQQALVGAHYLTQNLLEGMPSISRAAAKEESN